MSETVNGVAADIKADWIADGTAAAEPVTTETPVVETAGQPRAPDGTFAPAHATPTPAASSASATAPAATPAAAIEYIEAQLADGTVFQVPKGIKLPVKRGGVVEYDPIQTVLSERMMERDYRIKTDELARQRRESEQRDVSMRADQAKVEARSKWLEEREAELVAAQKDPAKWEAYQQMQALYQTNPQFRRTLDDALAKRETDAENQVYREQEYRAQVQHGTDLAASWITQGAQEFPGVDPERVRTLYAQALSAGQATLDPTHVRAIYERESQYLTTSRGPLEKQLADLKAQVESLTAVQTAEKQNGTVKHAVQRAKTPPVATVGNPPAPASQGQPTRFGQNELVERNAAWARQR